MKCLREIQANLCPHNWWGFLVFRDFWALLEMSSLLHLRCVIQSHTKVPGKLNVLSIGEGKWNVSALLHLSVCISLLCHWWMYLRLTLLTLCQVFLFSFFPLLSSPSLSLFPSIPLSLSSGTLREVALAITAFVPKWCITQCDVSHLCPLIYFHPYSYCARTRWHLAGWGLQAASFFQEDQIWGQSLGKKCELRTSC